MEKKIKQKSPTLHRYLFTVTTFSKLLAMYLFILFPFVGFYLGMRYQEKIDMNTVPIGQQILKTPLETPSPQTYSLNNQCKQDSDCEIVNIKQILTSNGKFGVCGIACGGLANTSCNADYSSSNYITVNKDWLNQQFKSSINPKTICHCPAIMVNPKPACTSKNSTDKYKLSCINNTCLKIRL